MTARKTIDDSLDKISRNELSISNILVQVSDKNWLVVKATSDEDVSLELISVDWILVELLHDSVKDELDLLNGVSGQRVNAQGFLTTLSIGVLDSVSKLDDEETWSDLLHVFDNSSMLIPDLLINKSVKDSIREELASNSVGTSPEMSWDFVDGIKLPTLNLWIWIRRKTLEVPSHRLSVVSRDVGVTNHVSVVHEIDSADVDAVSLIKIWLVLDGLWIVKHVQSMKNIIWLELKTNRLKNVQVGKRWSRDEVVSPLRIHSIRSELRSGDQTSISVSPEIHVGVSTRHYILDLKKIEEESCSENVFYERVMTACSLESSEYLRGTKSPAFVTYGRT